MIVITDISYIEVDRDYHEYVEYTMENLYKFSLDEQIKERKSIKHIIRGKKFCTTNGKCICLGITPKVRKLLGLPLTIFDDMNDTIKVLRKANVKLLTKKDRYKRELTEMQNRSFFNKLKSLLEHKIW